MTYIKHTHMQTLGNNCGIISTLSVNDVCCVFVRLAIFKRLT